MKKTIGITLGDQAGIGPELVQAVLASGKLPDSVHWRIIGTPLDTTPGCPTPTSAQAAWDALEESVLLLKDGSIDAVVTSPVSKAGLMSRGFTWEGQTEFYAERLNAPRHAMCLSGDRLTVGLATTHVALSDVPRLLGVESLVEKGTLLAEFCLKARIRKHRDKETPSSPSALASPYRPRIAVCALNPHAGEDGAFGREEITIIRPALQELSVRCPYADFSGPHVPDALFREAYMGLYDAVFCMYHDQGLIPLKMVDFDTAVNVTLGLPYPRVSPDHGTAFNIAGKGLANPSSMLNACLLAERLIDTNRA